MRYNTRFRGPLFIIGMARSGTTLLLSLLNRSPRISLPPVESHFIPYMVSTFGNPPRLRDDYQLLRFYRDLSETTFFWYMEKQGIVLDREYFSANVDRGSWNAIFEFIFRFYAFSKEKDENFIWGDKTPRYLNYIGLLKNTFPEAKFIHVIRDPRDCLLSMKKAVGVSILRAAERWRRTMENSRVNGLRLNEDYMEVRYESLLDDPETVMRDICEFLNCEFVSSMTTLERPVESMGDRKDATRVEARIVKENRKKYITQLSPSVIKRVEEIVYPAAKSLGYEFEYSVNFVPLNPSIFRVLTVYDLCLFAGFYLKRWGIFRAAKYLYKRRSF